MSKRRQKVFYKRVDVLLGGVIVVLVLYLVFLYLHTTASKISPCPPLCEGQVATTTAPFMSAFDGSGVYSKAEMFPQVVGVMIDNHPDARPQAGLDEARVVYEAPVEGGVTRYFALFAASSTVAKVGPVRSARSYFLDWLSEYGDGLYMHSGGSPAALALLKQDKYFDANEFWFGQYYWRSDDRLPPHNLYTSGNKWRALLDRYGGQHKQRDWEGWKFSNTVLASTTVKAISISYNSDYKVGWIYNAATKKFERSVNGVAQVVQSGAQIAADNVVLMEVPTRTIDEEGRKEVTTVGSGSARVLRQGTFVRATWKKTNPSARTRLYDTSGSELAFVPGVTWVEVAPVNTAVTVTD